MLRPIERALDWVGRANALTWAWTVLPSGFVSGLIGWLAWRDLQRQWAIALACLASFALAAMIIASFRKNRVSSMAKLSYDELRKRAYESHLAELEGKAAAEQKHVTDKFFRSMTSPIAAMAEEADARRQARLDRIKAGQE